MINERTQIIIRLVSTHLILIPVLILISLFVNRDAYLLLSISQSLIVILIIQVYLLIELIKMFVVIFRNENNNFEIRFPFQQGKYIITDGGNSKVTRMMEQRNIKSYRILKTATVNPAQSLKYE